MDWGALKLGLTSFPLTLKRAGSSLLTFTSRCHGLISTETVGDSIWEIGKILSSHLEARRCILHFDLNFEKPFTGRTRESGHLRTAGVRRLLDGCLRKKLCNFPQASFLFKIQE